MVLLVHSFRCDYYFLSILEYSTQTTDTGFHGRCL